MVHKKEKKKLLAKQEFRARAPSSLRPSAFPSFHFLWQRQYRARQWQGEGIGKARQGKARQGKAAYGIPLGPAATTRGFSHLLFLRLFTPISTHSRLQVTRQHLGRSCLVPPARYDSHVPDLAYTTNGKINHSHT